MSSRSAAERRLQTIHLLRHAHAGDPEGWRGDDDLRPLTIKGRHQAERLGAFLVHAGVRPDRLLTSPKIGSAQTAELVGQALELEPEEDERLAEGCTLGVLDAVVGDSGAREPMLVGHDPDFSMLMSGLIGTSGQTLRKCALATIDVRRPLRAGTGSLRWLLPPELLDDGAP